MVDSLYIQTNHSKPSDKIIWDTIKSDYKTGLLSQTGNLKNLRVREHEDGLFEIWGSLPKYLSGSNVNTFTRSEIREAIEQLICDTGIDPDACRVYSLDVAATLPVQKKVVQYFRILGDLSRFTRKTYGRTGVTYESKGRSLTFYDKGKEAGIEGELLRVELKLKSKLKQQLGWSVFLSDLCRDDKFEQLVQWWEKEYSAVRKIKRHSLVRPMGTKDLKDQLARLGMNDVGVETLLNSLDSWEMDSLKRRRCKKMIRDLSSSGNSENDTCLIIELDRAIQLAVEMAVTS